MHTRHHRTEGERERERDPKVMDELSAKRLTFKTTLPAKHAFKN